MGIELNLHANQLSKLPLTLGLMTKLSTINVADNNLTELPLSIGLLPLQVWSLSLSRSTCSLVTEVFVILQQDINCENNPFSDADMIKKYEIGVDHFLSYLERRVDKHISMTTDNFFKILKAKRNLPPDVVCPPLPPIEGYSPTGDGEISIQKGNKEEERPKYEPTIMPHNRETAKQALQRESVDGSKGKLVVIYYIARATDRIF